MSANDIVEMLLQPLPGAEPCGRSLRYDPVYDTIREARREEDPALPQGPWERELKRADWPLVATSCTSLLNETSKDLQLAAWLLEAWVHTEGARGIRNGLRLIHGLCIQYWDELHPLIVSGDAEYRCGPLIWLDEKLPASLGSVPLTEVESVTARNYRFGDWERVFWQENELRRVHAASSATVAEGELTRAVIMASIQLTPGTFYRDLDADLEGSLKLLKALDALLDSRLQREAPGFSRLRKALIAMQAITSEFLPTAANDSTLPETLDAPVPVIAAGSEARASIMQTDHHGIRSREEAYRRLAEIADFLARTEPHSPTPHLIRRAIAWGNMSVAELLQDLVQSEADLKAVYSLLGLNRT